MVSRRVELSEVQKGIYFECQAGGKNIYNISAAIRVKGDIDKDKFEQALNQLINEQAVLHSHIEFEENKLMMIVDKIQNATVYYYDVTNKIDSDQEIDTIIKQEMEYQFDLSKSPLFRVSVIINHSNETIIVLNIHHLIADGISLNIFINKLSAYYSDIPDNNVIKCDYGYFDFIEKENKKLQNGFYEKQKKFWKNKVKNAKPLGLPKDFNSTHNNYGLGKEKRFPICKQLMLDIEKASKKEGVTPFIFCLSAFAVLMGKCCNEKEVTISSPITYRPGFDYSTTLGCFIYTLPLCCNLNEDKTFRQVVSEMYTEMIGIYENIGYPNNLIARESSSGVYTGLQSIYDISFVYDKFNSPVWNDIICEAYDTKTVTFPGNIMAVLCKMPDRDVIKIQYKPDLYSSEIVEIIGKRFIKMLEAAVLDTNLVLSNYDLFLENEKERIFYEFNQSSFFEHRPSHIINIFHERVELYPDSIALLYDDRKMSYEEVNISANQLARKILNYKKKKNEIIGVQLKRSKEMVISILAILKTGCAYVPIENYYPDSRKQYIFKDADISILITSSDLASDFCKDKIIIYADDHNIYKGESSNLDIILEPFDLAYIEYTSGSTGEPKGVMIENHSVVNTIMDLERRFPVGKDDRYLYKTPFSFDISGTELYGWFAGKGALCILEHGREKDPELILEYIDKYKITHINFVPTMFSFFLEILNQKTKIDKLKSLKWIFVGGEAVTTDTIDKFFDLEIDARLENVYGPTECTMWASNYSIKEREDVSNVSIGYPLNEIRCYVIDKAKCLQMIGVPGELCLSGVGLARGYLNKKELTQEKFCDNPFYDSQNDPDWFRKIYRTGDLVRWLPNGTIEFMGRLDFQVNLNGIRIELGEIETALGQYSDVIKAVVVAKQTANQIPVLCAYYLATREIQTVEFREYLSEKIPAYMIPSYFIRLKELPINSSGKIDTKILIADSQYKNYFKDGYKEPKTLIEKIIAEIWKDVLELENIGIDYNFFDIGGNSMSAILLHKKLKIALNEDFPITVLFQYPTVRLLSAHFMKKESKIIIDRNKYFKNDKKFANTDVAIIGMAIDVPGAIAISEFWNNLKQGKESINFYKDDELRLLGLSDDMIHNKNFVKVKNGVSDFECFDADFFDYTPSEVKKMSPQLRLLYKGVWEALEDAGYYPGSTEETVGVFIGGSDDFQWYNETIEKSPSYSDAYQAFTMSTNHFLATRLAYKFNFRGPALSALTGCSTTLVTSHLACQSLMLGECDMALSGGITIELRNRNGYLYQDGMMFSPDGHCRPFDSDAKGTVFSNGMGIVVLKRLEEAVAAGDHIYAVIKGSAINNDGNQKVGFAAPSIEGQAEVIQKAYKRAEIDPETIGYVEAHGTGTILGDPIEVDSLTKAFATEKRGFCRLGSVKGNIGHTDTAAGVIGLIKVALTLDNRYIPGTVNYQNPNPKINFEDTPFAVSSIGQEWETENGIPLRAGLNSFGVGGTNAHMVLEEAPKRSISSSLDKVNLLLFSGKTEKSLDKNIRTILNYIGENENVNRSDAAWTLMTGRKHFLFRKAVVINEKWGKEVEFDEFIQRILDSGYSYASDKKKIYFMFSGQGNQYQGIGRGLYYAIDSYLGKRYHKYIDQIFKYLSENEQQEFLEIIYGNAGDSLINETKYSQFALFVTEYATAKVLIDLGLHPDAFIGHSIGEVTAAAVAGVWTLADAVKVVRTRGDLMQKQLAGKMLAVMLGAAEVKPMLIDGVYLALNNTSNRCVVGGKPEKIDAFHKLLVEQDIKATIIRTSHAFHTEMMKNAAEEFGEFLKGIEMKNPNIPIVSNVTGQWVEENQMNSIKYWTDHIVYPVQFDKNLETVLKENHSVYIEVGAGRSLCTLAIQHSKKKENQIFINMLRHSQENEDDLEYFYQKIGELWSNGLTIDWERLIGNKLRNKISLPTYQFDNKSYPVKVALNHDNHQSKDSLYQGVEVVSQVVVPQSGIHTLEENIVKAFKIVLGFENIMPDQNFFELGGDSLKAVSLSNTIERELGLKIPISEIFNRSTPRRIALYLNELSNGSFLQNMIIPVAKAPFYNLSSAQKRMFSLYQLNKTSIAYNLPSATIIEGRLDENKVREVAAKLLQRHEILRTSFDIRDNKVVQIVEDRVEMDISFIEQSITNEKELSAVIDNFVRPFDLSKAPLCRLKLITVSPQKSILLFDVHHIIADGTSVEILKKDFNDLFVSSLEPLELQYKDFAEWQNLYLESSEVQEAKEYWIDLFKDCIPVLNLPLDWERPQIKTFSGGRIYFSIKSIVAEQLEQLAQLNGATMYMVLLSAWYVLLARYSGQEDIVIGTPVAGRINEKVSNIIGMFVNMLAMRNNPDADKKFIDFFREVKTNTIEAFKYQNYQFDNLIEHLTVNRQLNRNVLFDVCFDYQNIDIHDLNIEGHKVTSFQYDPRTVAYDLVLTCQQGKSKEIECFIDYSSDLFELDSIERMVSNYVTVLESIINDAETKIGEINILSLLEKELLDKQFKRSVLDINSGMLIHEIFEDNVRKYPNKIALITSDGKEFTYIELNNKVNMIANKLISLNVVSGDLIGILTKRNVWMIASMLGILKAGSAYIPIDFSFPKERINYMIQKSNPKVILVDQVYSEKLEYDGPVINCATLLEESITVRNPDTVYTRNPLAYVIFTSGSTGNPKGVMVSHQAVTNFIYDIKNRKIFATPEDRIICITTSSFDIFAFESIVPLCTGHSIYIASESEQLDPVLVANKIVRYDVTHILSTVSRIKAFVENNSFESALKQLKCILSGGENFPIQLLELIRKKSDSKIFNMYGPTETTIWSTSKELTNVDYINIGYPIANTQIFILSKHGKLQPCGVYGEICVSGKGLAEGYYNDLEETKKRFTSVDDLPDIRIYKTGDSGRILSNGEIEISGRLDNQVKVRGYRIELDEIEKVALKHKSVVSAVAKVMDMSDQNKEIVLFYCQKESILQNSSLWLKEWMESILPSYMLPRDYILLEHMPILPNGKLDKNALTIQREIINEEEQINEGQIDESRILNIWKKVLQKEEIGIHDNFFDIGGNSLALIMVNNKITNELGISIPMVKLFEYPTVVGILHLLKKEKNLTHSDNIIVDRGDFDDDNFEEPIKEYEQKKDVLEEDIAVIGMACRFPEAENIEEFWQNIVTGKESIMFFNDEELIESGIREEILNKENYVRAKGFLEGIEYFDAKLFGYSEKEAQMMDPQIRLLHQCTYEVLENAGYNSFDYNGKIAMFAGSGLNLIWMTRYSDSYDDIVDGFEAVTYNEKDFLTSRISYKLNLKGPSINVQTACSTSLVAIHQAIKALNAGETDMAIAGGVCISYPRKEGYLWHEGMIFAKDGHCRAFSNDATGTVPGNGCGVVMLKPLKKALNDRDHIYAVIKGSAVNNDGINKIGYTAPSVKGQCEVLKEALVKAKTVPEEIQYLEAHGTGTSLGDPIEIEAVRQAWNTDKKGYCALGSVKANIGHLDAASGVAGFIKAVLILNKKIIPPMVNFNRPNEKLDLKNSPFYINTEAKAIDKQQKKIKVAVSSFGIGGTNAHIILEEAD